MDSKEDINKIDEELIKRFPEQEARKEIIRRHKNRDCSFFGKNEDGELVELYVSSNGLTLKTYQNNGWIRVNYYDEDGDHSGETFEGRWDL